MKRKNKLCGVFIITFVILSTCLITCSAFSNQLPVYLSSFGNPAYIEIQASNFGRCALVLPVSYSDNTLSYTSSNIVNVTSGTIYGYLVTQNGTTYDVRGQRLSALQYVTSSGYQTIYNDITYTQIYNTNIRFTNNDSDNEFVKLSAYQVIIITVLLFLACAEIFNGFMSFVKRGRYV